MTTDALIERDGEMAELSPETIAKLNEVLPTFWSHGNPVDVLGDAPPERFGKALEIVLQDKGVDAVLVILTPQAMTDCTGTAQAVGEVAAKAHKPVLSAWMGGQAVADGVRLLNQAGIPTYTTPEKAVRAFMHLVSYARNLSTLHETPRDIPLSFRMDRQRLRGVFDTILTEGTEILSENVSKAFLEAYEIPVTKPQLARSADEAVEVARRCGYPVVLKIHSPQITHKTDVGGVMLNLSSDDAVRHAFERMVKIGRREGARRHHRRHHRAEDGHLSEQLRADPRGEEGPDLRVGDHGGDGRGRGRVVPRPGVGLAAAQRVAGPAGPRIAQVLAAVARLSRQAGGEHRPAHRDPHAVLLPHRRLPRDQGTRRQSAPGDAGRRDRPGRPGGGRPAIDGPLRAAVFAPGHPALSRRVRHRAAVEGRHAGDPPADQARGRADVARAAVELLDPVALVPLQLPLQADDPRDGRPATASSTTTGRSASWPRWRRTGSGS